MRRRGESAMAKGGWRSALARLLTLLGTLALAAALAWLGARLEANSREPARHDPHDRQDPQSRARAGQNVRIFYTPSSEALRADIDLIGDARKKIDFAGYVLTDSAVIEALTAAARRGVLVRLYLDHSFVGRGSAKSKDVFDALGSTPGATIRFKAREGGMMHLKSYSVDDRFLRTGSANFSYSGGRYQDNDVAILDSPSHAKAFSEHFETMWTRPDNEGYKP